MIPNLILGFKHKMIFHRYHANTNDLPKGLKLRDFLLHSKFPSMRTFHLNFLIAFPSIPSKVQQQ